MLHHSKFPLFALLALLCAAVSGCSSSHMISSDPKTTEDILEKSMDHPAHVTLMNGKTLDCFEVAIRKDSTRWRGLGKFISVPTDSVASISGDRTLLTLINGSKITCYDAEFGKKFTTWRVFADVSVPTDSVASIRVADPQTGAIVLGVIVGGIIGGIIGNALYSPPPPTPPNETDLFASPPSFYQNLDIVLGVLGGAALGGDIGALISSNTDALYTNDIGRVAPDSLGKKLDSVNERRIYPPNDTLNSPDTTQTKLPH